MKVSQLLSQFFMFVIVLPLLRWLSGKKKFNLRTWSATAALFLIIAFIFFFINTNKILPPLSTIDRITYALDISLAHLTVTFIMATLSWYLYLMVFAVMFITALLIPNLIEDQSLIKRSIGLFISISLIALSIIIFIKTYQFNKLLLIDTIDLQVYLFGAFDSSLGVQYPTTFRITAIIDNISNLTNNPILSKIFWLIAIVVGFITASKSFWESIEFFSKKLNKN